MYTNGVNTYNKVHDEKPQLTSQQFTSDGESFMNFMEKEEPTSGELRETAKELAEDESILSTDEENRAMARRGQEAAKEEKPKLPQFPEDKARMLKLMDMSNKLNMSNLNISKSKKEVENTVGKGTDDVEEQEDITSVIAKIAAARENNGAVESDDVEADINTDKHPEDFEEEGKKDNSQVLHETEEELLEDMSILSTEEENLEMARRNAAMNRLSDEDYKTSEDDMMFMNDIVALNNQMHVEKSDVIQNTQNVMSALMSQTNSLDNRIDVSELTSNDVDCLIGFLRTGTQDSSHFTDENNEELVELSAKFLALLRDSIINKKVFRIDFDNQISVIIRINTEGKLVTEFLTNDDAIETYLKNNLHVLKQRFEELKVDYEDITYKNTTKEI